MTRRLSTIIVSVLAIMASLLLCLPAFGIGLGELGQAARELRDERDSAAARKAEIENRINEIDLYTASVNSEGSRERFLTDQSVIALYKMDRSRNELLDMVLDADSLLDAISIMESYSSVITSCSARLHEIAISVSDAEAEKAELEAELVALNSSIAEAEIAIEQVEGDAKAARDEIEVLLAGADNSTLARISASMAYSQKVRFCDGYPATEVYARACEGVIPGDWIPNGRSCDRGVMIPVRVAGTDMEFPPVCTSQAAYLRSSDRWVDLGVWNGSTSSLQPGDILISIAGVDGASYDHSCMYVGYDIAQEMYDKVIKGTDGDLGRPGSEAVFSSASYQWGSTRGRALCLCWDGEAGSHVYRCVAPQGSDTYAYLRVAS